MRLRKRAFPQVEKTPPTHPFGMLRSDVYRGLPFHVPAKLPVTHGPANEEPKAGPTPRPSGAWSRLAPGGAIVAFRSSGRSPGRKRPGEGVGLDSGASCGRGRHLVFHSASLRKKPNRANRSARAAPASCRHGPCDGRCLIMPVIIKLCPCRPRPRPPPRQSWRGSALQNTHSVN